MRSFAQKYLRTAITTLLLLAACIHLHAQSGWELYEQGAKSYEQGNIPETIRLMESAAEKIKSDSGQNHIQYAEVIGELASIYIAVSSLDRAEELSTTATKLAAERSGTHSLEYAKTLLNPGNIASIRKDFNKAEKLYQEAIGLFSKYVSSDDVNYLYAVSGLAGVYYWTDEYNKSIHLNTMILETYKKAYPELIQEYIYILVNLGEAYRAIGAYKKSLLYFDEAMDLFESKKIPDTHPAYPNLLNNMSSLFASMANYSRAEALLKESIQKSSLYSKSYNPNLVGSLNNLGYVQFLQKKYPEAIGSYNAAMNVLHTFKMDTSIYYVVTLNNLGLLYIDRRDPVKSDSLLQEAEQIYQKLPSPYLQTAAGILYNKGAARQLAGNFQQAFGEYTKAGNMYMNYIAHNFYGLSSQDKLHFTASLQRRFHAIPSLVYCEKTMNNGEVAEQIFHTQMVMKNMVLRDQQGLYRMIHNSHDTILLHQYDNWKKNKGILAKAVRSEETDSLTKATEELEQRISVKSSTFAEDQRYFYITSTDVANKLHAHEAAVEFVRFSLYHYQRTDTVIYAALVMKAGSSVPQYIQLCTERELQQLLKVSSCNPGDADKLIMDLYQTVRRPNNTSKGELLYSKIWKPLLPYLKDARTIYLAPTGLLYQVSFQAIPSGISAMLGDKYTFRYVLSTGDLVVKQLYSENRIQQLSLWANISYEPNKKLLQNSNSRNPLNTTGNVYFQSEYQKGMCTVRQKWPALHLGEKQVKDLASICRRNNIRLSVYQHTQATEDTLKSIRFNTPSALHISTHGFFIRDTTQQTVQNFSDQQSNMIQSTDPLMRSGIILSGANAAWRGEQLTGKEDGIVTAYEIAQMDLTNAQLVVLDACESALGNIFESEGVFGLQRSLRIAGADKIMMSLWKVPEKETNELMNLFYNGWLKGKPVYQALKDAQSVMQKKHLPPYYWAGFIVAE